MRLKLLFLLSLIIASCTKDVQTEAIDASNIDAIQEVAPVDYFDAFNRLNLPIEPTVNTGKGENWIDIAWFSLNGDDYVYVRSDNYSGAETCYAFVEEELISYTLSGTTQLVLESSTSTVTYDIESGLYDGTFATSYNDLYNVGDNGAISPNLDYDVNDFRFDGDCLLANLIEQAEEERANSIYTIDNAIYEERSYQRAGGGAHSWKPENAIGYTGQYSGFGTLLQDRYYIITENAASISSQYSEWVDRRSGNQAGNSIFANSDNKKTLIRVLEQGVGSSIVEVMDTDYSGDFSFTYGYITQVYFDIDTDEDGVIDFHDVFPFDGTETADTDMDGVGDNADALPMIHDPFTGWIYKDGDNEYISNRTDYTLTELGEVIDYFNGKIYIRGHVDTDGETIRIAIDSRNSVIEGVVDHVTHATFGAATTIPDHDSKFDVATTGTAYKIVLED